MTTLSLADLDTKMRRQLGLAEPCDRSRPRSPSTANPTVTLPVVKVSHTAAPCQRQPQPPGAEWLKNGLHHLRIAAVKRTSQGKTTGKSG